MKWWMSWKLLTEKENDAELPAMPDFQAFTQEDTVTGISMKQFHKLEVESD